MQVVLCIFTMDEATEKLRAWMKGQGISFTEGSIDDLIQELERWCWNDLR